MNNVWEVLLTRSEVPPPRSEFLDYGAPYTGGVLGKQVTPPYFNYEAFPMKVKKTVTPLKLQANQENSKKSTGPNTPTGKANVRRNALKHGLTARRLMFASDGQPIDNGVAELVEALRAHYGSDDIVSELLIDNIAVDHWRQKQGLEAEIKYVCRKEEWSFYPQGSLPTLQRYNTANRRAMLKNLELLENRHADRETEADLETADGQDADARSDNKTGLANQVPTETLLDNAERALLQQPLPKPPESGAAMLTPEKSVSNSPDITLGESELSHETQQSENPAQGDTAA